MIADRHGRIADRLRISLTDRCDLRCKYCMPLTGNGFAPADERLTNDEILRVARVLVERTGLRRIRLTGGEPLLREGLVDLVAGLAALGLEDLALTTNGQLLAPKAAALAAAGLDRVNISLDTLRPERWERIVRTGRLERTLDGIDAALDGGLRPVKINVVVMRGENDDEVTDLVRFAFDRGVEIRFLELMAIGEAGPTHAARFVPTAEVVSRLEEEFTVEPADFEAGETARTYRVRNCRGPGGTVGFISPVSRPFCGSCRRLRLASTGLLRGCLMNASGPDVRAVLRGGFADWEDRLARKVLEAVRQKPWLSEMETAVAMHRLGG